MNKASLPQVVLAGLACLFLASCSTTSGLQRRITSHQSTFDGLPESEKKLVLQQKVSEGMSQDAVYLALGKPDARSEGSSGGTAKERWTYRGYRSVIRHDHGFGWGSYSRRGYYGRHGHGYGRYDCYPGSFYGGPTVAHIPYTAAIVNFTNKRVSSWEARAN